MRRIEQSPRFAARALLRISQIAGHAICTAAFRFGRAERKMIASDGE
jgi:hypothetical protein